MKKRILSVLLLSVLLLSACVSGEQSETEKSGEFIQDVSNGSDTEASFETSSQEGSEEKSEGSDETSIEFSSESGDQPKEESIDSSIEESLDLSVDSSIEESFDSEIESSVETPSKESEEPSSIPDSSYEVMDTPVIPVPDKLVAAEEDAFFNDSVFVGNSIMLGYQKFTNKQRAGSIENFLGNSKFFVAGSFGVYHNNRTPASKADSCNPSYEGVKYSVEDAVGVMGVKTVYINFMGLNDLSLYYDSKNCARKCADDVIKMIGKINEKYPDVNVVILSATYITASRNNRPSLNNKNLSMLNNYLLDYCNENGLDFVDIASQLTEKGCLADKYASDGYCHIWTKGYMVWTAILRDYAVRKMNGTYTNPEKMPLLGINK